MGWSNGNSFDAQNDYALAGAGNIRRPSPPWKFGVSPESMNEDRGSI